MDRKNKEAPMANTHYSGDLSKEFWAEVNALRDPLHAMVYLAGCALQDHELRVLKMLAEAKKYGKLKEVDLG